MYSVLVYLQCISVCTVYYCLYSVLYCMYSVLLFVVLAVVCDWICSEILFCTKPQTVNGIV